MIVVAGGTKGIGLEIADHYARKGETVIAAYAHDADAAETARARLARHGAPVYVVPSDLATAAGCAGLATALAAIPGTVDVLVHSVVRAVAGPVLDVDLEAFSAAINANGMSLLWCVRALLPRMARGSSIVFLSSRGGRVVVPSYAAVGVAKALAESLMRYLAVELAPRGIRINAVAPSIVDTGAVRAIFGAGTDAALRHAAEANPTGRAIEPGDYTAVVDFLTSPAAAFVQGQVLSVNGGSNLMA